MSKLIVPTENDVRNVDPKEINNLQYMLKDVIQGDISVLQNMEDVDMDIIKTALQFLTQNAGLSEKEKLDLITDSWRVNFKAKPPTPEEFLTHKYIGPSAEHTHPWVKQEFKEFMNPSKPYRNLILYPH